MTDKISIHAPREGSDLFAARRAGNYSRFLSTLPVRGATDVSCNGTWLWLISIHAPREGSDSFSLLFERSTTYFYPRSP